MSHCANRELAIVAYKFKNKLEQKISFSDVSAAGIDVHLSQLPYEYLGGRCRIPYTIHYSFIQMNNIAGADGKSICGRLETGSWSGFNDSNRIFGPGFTVTVRSPNWGILNDLNEYFPLPVVATNVCEFRPTTQSYGSNLKITGVVPYDPYNLGIPDDCGDPPPKCKIEILSNQQLMFSDVGDCPGTFEVSCDGCPPHHIKCLTKKHPGYCCIPCKTIAAELEAMKLKVRRING